MSSIQELADRVERLLLRHGELQRTNALLHEQLATVIQERDNLRSRLNAARTRIDVLLERLPQAAASSTPEGGLASGRRETEQAHGVDVPGSPQ